MIRSLRLTALAAAVALLTAAPFAAHAQHVASSAAATHSLPKGSATIAVFSFGVQGGSLRPWSVKLALDGTVTATGTTAGREKLVDPANSLKGLLALADAEGYFSMKKTVGCLGSAGNPDVSTRFISIHTSTVKKRVSELGSCAATAKYDQLYALLEGAAGVGS